MCGGGWYTPPFRRPAQLGRRTVQIAGMSGHSDPAVGYCCAAFGVAGVDAVTVEVTGDDGVTTWPIESPFGAFVAACGGRHEATLRVLDGHERPIYAQRFPADL